MKKVYKIDDPVYDIPIYFFIGTLSDCGNFIFQKFKVTVNIDEDSLGRFFSFSNPKNRRRVHVIWLPKYIRDIDSHTALSHECLHAAVETLSNRGVPINRDGDEALAYLHEFYYSAFLKKLERKGKKKK